MTTITVIHLIPVVASLKAVYTCSHLCKPQAKHSKTNKTEQHCTFLQSNGGRLALRSYRNRCMNSAQFRKSQF